MAQIASTRTTSPRAALQSSLTALWWRGYTKPHARFDVATQDGVAIHGAHFHAGRGTLVVYCHGFLSGKNYLAVPRFVEMLAEDVDAIVFDFRGHGESGGASTVGEREVLDLDAVMEYARGFGYRRIFLVGSSMGGAVAINYAARTPAVAGVATIGCFAHRDFGMLANLGLEMLRLPFVYDVVRVARKTRVESFIPRSAPRDVIAQISPRPVLIIHGAYDLIVHPRHARELYARARAPKQLIVIPRGSHDIPNLQQRTKEWIVDWCRRFA